MANESEALWHEYSPSVIKRCQWVLRSKAPYKPYNGNFYTLDEGVKEAVQEVFSLFLKRLKRLPPIKKPKNYINRIATNVCLDRLKDDEEEEENVSPIPLEYIGEICGNGSIYENKERKRFEATVKQLILEKKSEEIRTALYLYFFDGLILEEVAKIVGKSPAWVGQKTLAFKKEIRLKLKLGKDVI